MSLIYAEERREMARHLSINAMAARADQNSIRKHLRELDEDE